MQDFPEVDIGWRQQQALAGSGEIGDMGAHRIDFCHDVIGPIARVIGLTRINARPAGDWRTPFERAEPVETIIAYEEHQLAASLAYLQSL